MGRELGGCDLAINAIAGQILGTAFTNTVKLVSTFSCYAVVI